MQTPTSRLACWARLLPFASEGAVPRALGWVSVVSSCSRGVGSILLPRPTYPACLRGGRSDRAFFDCAVAGVVLAAYAAGGDKRAGSPAHGRSGVSPSELAGYRRLGGGAG